MIYPNSPRSCSAAGWCSDRGELPYPSAVCFIRHWHGIRAEAEPVGDSQARPLAGFSTVIRQWHAGCGKLLAVGVGPCLGEAYMYSAVQLRFPERLRVAVRPCVVD